MNEEPTTVDYQISDTGQDLFDAFIHPVLDLLGVPLDSIGRDEADAKRRYRNLEDYLRSALTDRDRLLVRSASMAVHAQLRADMGDAYYNGDDTEHGAEMFRRALNARFGPLDVDGEIDEP